MCADSLATWGNKCRDDGIDSKPTITRYYFDTATESCRSFEFSRFEFRLIIKCQRSTLPSIDICCMNRMASNSVTDFISATAQPSHGGKQQRIRSSPSSSAAQRFLAIAEVVPQFDGNFLKEYRRFNFCNMLTYSFKFVIYHRNHRVPLPLTLSHKCLWGVGAGPEKIPPASEPGG